jgi:hypothetical protein
MLYGIIGVVGGIWLTASSLRLDVPLQAKMGGPLLAVLGLVLVWIGWRAGMRGSRG